MNFITRIFPFLAWFKSYQKADLRQDLLAGITVALVLIPQSMAYAQLAGLPAYYGLYAAFLPPLVAALFGSSNQLATGPVAVVSLMTAASLEPLATAGSAEFVAYAILLALMVGVFQLLLGVLRLGIIVNFLSHPVVNGFTNAAALIIATSQLSKIFGVHVDKAEHHYQTVYRVLESAWAFTHWPTLGMAVLAFGIMIGLRKLNPRIPNVLVAVVVTTFLAWLVGFEDNETVPLEQIESAQTKELVADLNLAMGEQAQLERQRADNSRFLDGAADAAPGSTESTCFRCHQDPDPVPAALDKHQLLHQMAGLMDQRIHQAKERSHQARLHLRKLLFEAVRRPDQSLHFFLRGEAPSEEEKVGHIWRIKLGKLAGDSLTMVGGGAVVATVPDGLPDFLLPGVDWAIDWRVVARLIFMSMIISLLGFMEAMSIAKAMAARTHQRLDPNQELIGQGLANIIGCIGQSYAVSGSFSRSAVNLQAGARTGMSSVFSSGVVALVLLLFTGLLYHLPQAVLAAIIMMAVIGLLNVRGFVHAWKAQRFDGITGVVTFAGTLLFAPHLERGIFIGVALSLGAYLFRTMKPVVAELSLHRDGSLRDAEKHELTRCRHIAAIRFDGPLNFASTAYLEDQVLKLVAEMPDLKHVFLAAHGINEIDASGEEMLSLLLDRLSESGYKVSVSGLKDNVVAALHRTHLYEKIGEKNIYPTQLVGISSIYAEAHQASNEIDCPFIAMRPHVAELALHSDGSFREAARHQLKTCQHIAVLRFDAPLTQATSRYLEEKIYQCLVSMPQLKHVLIAAHGIHEIDSYGVETVRSITEQLRKRDFDVSFSGFKENVQDVLAQHLLLDLIGAEAMFPTLEQAIASIHAQAHQDATEPVCPLVKVVSRT